MGKCQENTKCYDWDYLFAMKKQILLYFFIIYSSFLHADDCFLTTTKIIFNRTPELEKATLCEYKTSDKMLFYVSKKCTKGNCEILKREKKPIVIKNYQSVMGSPGFKLCDALFGVPQIFDFLDRQKKWQSTERCFFGRDFVEISLLTREWKSFIKN